MNIKEENNKFVSRGCGESPSIYHNNDNIYKHRCCKLDAHNWLENIPKTINNNFQTIVEVRFKNSRKDFFQVPSDLEIDSGDIVAVESTSGHDVGIVTLTGETVLLQMKKKRVKIDTFGMKKIYRRARLPDIEKWISSVEREHDTMLQTRRLSGELELKMKINDVEYQADNTKAIFYYTAEDRVDFRELIKILAERFRVRIEMKQIGVRQEASRVGGIGSCGRELCCSTWLCNFKSVSTFTARTQQLTLNPQKLAGQCSKLKCCLNYEQETYLDQLKRIPNSSIILKTKQGNATFVKTDVFKKIMWYNCEGNHAQLFPLSISQVSKLIELNNDGVIPEKLDEFSIDNTEKTGYENVVNQDDLNRFDKKKNQKKNRNKKNNRQKNNNQQRRHNK